MLTLSYETPADPVVAALGECLSEESVLSASRAQLTSVSSSIRAEWCRACRIETLYHPRRYVRVVYALLRDAATPTERYWPEADLVYFQTPIREPVSRRGQVVQLGAHPVEAYVFPNDRRLRGVRHVAGRQESVALLNQWGSRNGVSPRFEPKTLQRKLIRYVPEQKWVVRLRAECDSPEGRLKQRVAVRAGHPNRLRTLAERHQTLSAMNGGDGETFRIPALVGSIPERGIIGVEWLRGQTLLETLIENDPTSVLRDVAVRLDRFHRVPITNLRCANHMTFARRARASVVDLAFARPTLHKELHELRRRVATNFAAGTASRATIHNDFHWNQLSIKRDRYGLFDLERLAEGDPLWDAANFATQLQMLGERPESGVDRHAGNEWRSVFIDAWSELALATFHPARFASYAALSRLELARGMMRHLRPGWTALVDRCVELAFNDLDSGADRDC